MTPQQLTYLQRIEAKTLKMDEQLDKLAAEVVTLTTNVAVLTESVDTLKSIVDKLMDADVRTAANARDCRAEIDKRLESLSQAQARVEGEREKDWKLPGAIAAVIGSASTLWYLITRGW